MKRIILFTLLLILSPKICYGIELTAKSACLITADTHEIIYEKNCNVRLPMASTTKMMTALIAGESDKWNDIVTVSLNAQNQIGSKIYLKQDDKILLSSLVKGMLLNSGNDAAVAVAEHISENTDSFSELMNKKAREIGAENTMFQNPSGLDEENHYSTAYDLALIASEILENERLLPIVKSKELKISNANGEIIYLKNHNKLLWSYDGLLGVKTGYTKSAGRCLVTAAERNGVRLIAVTLSAPNDWKEHTELLDYGFSVCGMDKVIKKGERLAQIDVGREKLCLLAGDDVVISNVLNKKEKREISVKKLSVAKPPINKGEKLGVAEVICNGRSVATVELVAERNVLNDNGVLIVKKWLNGMKFLF